MYDYRTNCTDCDCRLDCDIERHKKQYKGRCFIHAISDRTRKKPYEILKRNWILEVDDLLSSEDVRFQFTQMTEPEKREYMKNKINYWKKAKHNLKVEKGDCILIGEESYYVQDIFF